MAFGRRSWSRGRGSMINRSQGRMRADFSGAVPLIRHSVNLAVTNPGADVLGDGKARAYPLVVYYGTSSATAGESVTPTTSEGSRVNHVQCNLSISQSDTTKPNQVYIGFISTSFSDAALDATNMTNQFADLIYMYNASTGTMSNGIPVGDTGGEQDMTLNSWMKDSQQRHWIRGFDRNSFTLYSGRPALMSTVLPVPRKNKRQQFGSGFYMVVLNDSGEIQGEDSGGGTDINVSLKTFFKEIPQVTTAET